MSGYAAEEPIAAIASALAPAALGIIRASGKGAIELVAKIFSRPESLLKARSASMVYGWICAPSGVPNADSTAHKIDEVMVSVFRAPKSFSGEDMAEIYCHGGIAVVTAIYRLLLVSGFREGLPGEFTFRAFLNGKTDLTRAEAAREITGAKTDAARGRAVERLGGALFSEIDAVKKLLLRARAALEAEIEYPEDENAVADAFDTALLNEVERTLVLLCNSWQTEKLYQEGVKIVLAGKTNAGKSSLFNALLKEDRSIVSDTPGTTRDWIESGASIGGIPARLFDTAGLFDSADDRRNDDAQIGVIEQEGIARAHELIRAADAVLYVVDAVKGLDRADEEFIANAACEKSAQPIHGVQPIVVFNKADMLEKPYACKNQCPHVSPEALFVSAKSGEGVSALVAAIAASLGISTKTGDAQTGLGSARQKKAAEEALDSVRHALAAADEGFTADAIAQDIDDALGFLGEITGEVTPDDILNTIFAHFCVGK